MNIELINKILKKIEKYDNIAIYRHVFPDPDSYSSQIALKDIIKSTYPHKQVVILGGESENLNYIGNMDEEIEIKSNTLAIVVDVSNKERIDDQSFVKCDYIIKIDHHKPFTDSYEDLTWVDTNYTSCSEMILDIYLSNKNILKITQTGRKALFTGIIGDTGRFLYVDNPTKLFEKLTEITFDLNTKEIYSNMYKRYKGDLKFLGYIYRNFEETENGVAYLKVKANDLKEFDIEPIKAVRMVNALQDCDGIINWTFFVENPKTGEIMCEFRSSGPRVNDIAAQYEGGGHMLAAGATLKNWHLVDNIIRDFDENCKRFLNK